MIKKPNFADMLDRHTFEEQLKHINNWYDTNIQTVLDSAVEVGGWNNSTVWDTNMIDGSYHHKALLINVEPLKQETCADVLREIMECRRDMNGMGENTFYCPEEYFDRAKAALEREK